MNRMTLPIKSFRRALRSPAYVRAFKATTNQRSSAGQTQKPFHE